jgi:hypothetical protein
VNGTFHIRRAASILTGPGGAAPSREEVLQAFGYVWMALSSADEWPDPLRAQAAGLIVAMRRYGSRDLTARRMTDADVCEFAGMVCQFVELADRLELVESLTALRQRSQLLAPSDEPSLATANPRET